MRLLYIAGVAALAILCYALGYAGAGLPYLEKIMTGQDVEPKEIRRLLRTNVFIAMHDIPQTDTVVYRKGQSFFIASSDFYEGHELVLLNDVRVVNKRVYTLYKTK